MQDAMWRGHGGWEIAFTPFLLGGLGWLLDGQIGTTPIFTVLSVVAGLFGAVANQYYSYTNRMASLNEQRERAHVAQHGSMESAPAFAATEAAELPSYAVAADVDREPAV